MRSMLLFNFILYNCVSDFVQGNKNNNNDIDVTKTIVWGPGLDPENITMSARYIFVQLVNKDGLNITESVEDNLITSKISGITQDGLPCHIWNQNIDCIDGSYIIRYKIYHTCFNLKIVIKIQNEILYLKQSQFKGPVYEEECYCPNPSFNSWLTNNGCIDNQAQILSDLKLFPSINFDDLRNKIIARYDKPHSVSLCHYVIKSNKIYRHCYGQHDGFKMFMDKTLLSITRKTILPDIEFFMNLGDWPLVPENDIIYPIFSWCGSDDTKDIVLPTYDITESSRQAMDSIMLDMLSVQGNVKIKWNEKIQKVFWRGRDSRKERLNLIDIARSIPDLFNVSITNFFFFKNEMEKYGPEQKHVSFFEFFKYKYQLNIDGTVAAYRFPYLLAGNSLVFKQKSKYYEFFYKNLEEGKHFVSIKKDLSDLVEKVNWAIKNDEKAYNISREARKYARNHLMPQNIFCYHATLFKEWSRRLNSTVKVLPEMEYVPQIKNNCNCLNKKGIKDEL